MPEEGKKTILLVEDDDSLRSILAHKCTEEGFLVIEASDGAEGFELALRKHPDLILLDVMMRHDGIEMLGKLRADPTYGKAVPVILLTNVSPDAERVMHAIEAYEPAFFLIKANLSPGQVLDKVHEALEKHVV